MRVLQPAGCLPNVFNSISNWERSAFLDLLMEVVTFYVIKNDIPKITAMVEVGSTGDVVVTKLK